MLLKRLLGLLLRMLLGRLLMRLTYQDVERVYSRNILIAWNVQQW